MDIVLGTYLWMYKWFEKDKLLNVHDKSIFNIKFNTMQFISDGMFQKKRGGHSHKEINI